MGAPKLKWTAEEEYALKDGIKKHGAGKWRTILKDPEFSSILSSRSNVDLKDKWRNMCVVVNGCGSREKSRAAVRKSRNSSNDDNSMALSNEYAYNSDEIADVKQLAVSNVTPMPNRTHEKARLDILILEAINNMKEPAGSDKSSIAKYIDDQYEAPPNFNQILSGKLKRMTESRKLIKVKQKYRIAPSPDFSEGRNVNSSLTERQARDPIRIKRENMKYIDKPQVDSDLARIRNMNVEEAAASAARFVAEAEIAMAEAEEATREAEIAEADAEEAKAFVQALEKRSAANKMVVW